LNYGLAVLSVIVIGVVWNVRQRSETPIALVDESTASASPSSKEIVKSPSREDKHE
jgi:hypothetical protein